MPGTKAGAAKARATMIAKYGENFYKEIGHKGGKNGTGHAYGHGKVSPIENGRKGGLNRWKNREQAN